MSYPIYEVRFRPCRVWLRRTFRTALGEEVESCVIYLALIDKRGNVGYGEIAPSRFIVGSTTSLVLESLELLKKVIIDEKVLGTDYYKIDKIFEKYVRYPQDVLTGIDIAMIDLTCREFGIPLWKFLGAEKKELITDITVSLEDPEDMRDEISDYLSRGFEILKIKLGDPDRDLERIKILEEFNDKVKFYRIDANQGWRDLKTAIKFLKMLEKLKVELVEQPLPKNSLRELSILRNISEIPIILDESVMNIRDIVEVLIQNSCDGINIKLMKFGGIRRACTACEIAKALNLKLMIGCMLETKVSITAAACIAARYDIDYIDLDSPLLIDRVEIDVKGGVVYDGCKIILNDNPGLGVSIDL